MFILFFGFNLFVRGFWDCLGDGCSFLEGDSLYDFVDNGIFIFCFFFCDLGKLFLIDLLDIGFFRVVLWFVVFGFGVKCFFVDIVV